MQARRGTQTVLYMEEEDWSKGAKSRNVESLQIHPVPLFIVLGDIVSGRTTCQQVIIQCGRKGRINVGAL